MAKINFKNRESARQFSRTRTANGHQSKVVDNGATAAKRYAVDLAPVQKQ